MLKSQQSSESAECIFCSFGRFHQDHRIALTPYDYTTVQQPYVWVVLGLFHRLTGCCDVL